MSDLTSKIISSLKSKQMYIIQLQINKDQKNDRKCKWQNQELKQNRINKLKKDKD